MIKTPVSKYILKKIDKKLGNKFWSPIDVVHINDWVLRAAAIKGEFHWHSHKDDEFFLVYKGEIIIDTPNGPIKLKKGEGTVIPKGMRHRPKAIKRAVVLLFEPARLNTTGD